MELTFEIGQDKVKGTNRQVVRWHVFIYILNNYRENLLHNLVRGKKLTVKLSDKLTIEDKNLAESLINLAERERIKQANLEDLEKKCLDEYKSSEATLECTFEKQKEIGSEALKKNSRFR